jgi:DNA repair exonuclease SbcCD ATPase subunit
MKQKKIERIKHELIIAQTNIESERAAYLSEARWREETSTRLQELKQKIRTKKAEVDEQAHDLAFAQARLSDLIMLKRSLERNLEDIAQRERPEVQTLASEVGSYRQRVREGQAKLESAEEHLRKRREAFEQARHSENVHEYKNLMVTRAKLERRLQKWKMLLRASRETLQSLQAFSSVNFQRRATLCQTFEKYQRTKVDADVELRELELYSDMLEALWKEQQENWM